MGEMAAVLAEAVSVGARTAGGGVGEQRAESLVGEAGEAVVVGVVGESGVAAESGAATPGGGVAHRGRLLEGDADAAARGVFDGLFGLVVEVVVLQAVSGRSRGGEMGAGARATHPSDSRTWPRSTRRTMEGGIAWGGNGEVCVCVCVCERVQEVLRSGMCSERERVRFLTQGRSVQRKKEEKRSLLCQWALTQKQTLGSWFERRAAYSSDCSVELPLRPWARATPPS